jgi:hypothetical protein
MDEQTKKQYEMLQGGRTSVEDNLLLYRDSAQALPFQILELVKEPVVDLAYFRELKEKQVEVAGMVEALEQEKSKIEHALSMLGPIAALEDSQPQEVMGKVLVGPWKR